MLTYAFAGLLGVGPMIHGLQFLRFGRRSWTAIEWVWTASGASFALLPVIDVFVYFGGNHTVELVFNRFVVLFFYGTGPIAVLSAVPYARRLRTVPWSGWTGLIVTLSWSLVWWVAGLRQSGPRFCLEVLRELL